VTVAAKSFSAENNKTLRSLYYQFSEIKHGPALVLLDKDVLDTAVAVHNKLVDALAVTDALDYRDKVRCTLLNTPFELSLACRRMLGESLRKEAGGGIEPINPNYIMNWQGSCPKQ
jgi:hypothetical protein